MKTYFISGHLDLTPEEFRIHYKPNLDGALEEGASFVVGDARGADHMAQSYLMRYFVGGERDRVKLFHMMELPRNNVGFKGTVGGLRSDRERDEAMTSASTHDIAWLLPGR